MALPSMPRMSLVAQFDDLCRYTNVLTSGPEEEFRIFAEGQLKCMRKWKGSELEVAKLNEEISNLKSENRELKTEIKRLKDTLKEADDAKKQSESEKNNLARLIAIIKEVLLADGGIDYQTREKIFLLSTTCKPNFNSPPPMHTIEESVGSLLSASEIDQTDEDLESRSRRGRRSRGKRSSRESRAKNCSVICSPVENTTTKGTAGTVADYTSSSSPMIPPLIVQCVGEIESRGLKDIGLYRISCSEWDVKSLRDKFVPERPIPNLSDVDIHALCGVVKDFLRSLKEPLITCNAWQSFVDAADLRDDTESSYAFYRFIMDLPQPNRDTLSFLILHLQKIAASRFCKMDVENLARVFGPIVVGCSTADPAHEIRVNETTDQYEVMKRLLSLSFWQQFLNVESENFVKSVKGTPENLPAPRTRLGPIYASVQKRISKTLRKTPRNSKSSTPKRFTSPLWK